jgi:GT2 family glycosyltransferase
LVIRETHVVVVAFHAADQLDRCLAQLESGFVTTIVDNSSSVDVRRVAERHRARYIDPGRNLGFAAGVNVAVREVLMGPAADVLLLNPDALLAQSSILELSALLHRPGNEKVAAVAPRLLGPDGADERVLWPFPSPGRCWREAFGLGSFKGRDGFLTGAALLLRWEALREVGLFDERFFLYAEEADWQRRAREQGWESVHAVHMTGFHGGAGAPADPARREVEFHAAQETYIRKWFGTRGWFSYRLAACAGAVARAALLTGRRRAAAARRARLYARGPRRSAGLMTIR